MPDFDGRVGTSSTHGVDYEDQMITYLAIAACNEKLKDFWIATNVDGVGAWDDIILYTETHNGEKQLIFFQLKHKVNPEKNKFILKNIQDKPNPSKSKSTSKDILDIQKYVQSFEEIQKLLSDRIQKRFLKTKTFLESAGVPFKNMKFIFMTNTTVISQTQLLHKSKIEFFNTNPGGEIYQIIPNTAENVSQSNFFKQFFIYANQSGVYNEVLKNNINRKLQKFVQNQDFEYSNVAENVQLRIKKEFVEHGRKLKLSDVQEIISICILSSFKYDKDVYFQYLSLNEERMSTFQRLTEQYQLVLISENNFILDFFFDFSDPFYFIACKDNFNNLVIDSLKIIKNKKVIWFNSKTSMNQTVETLLNTDIPTLHFLKDLSEESTSLLSKHILTFQGKEAKFETLLESNPSIKDIFTVDDIISLLANQFKIGEPICEIPQYYVSRTIPRIIVNKSVIFKMTESFFIILVNNIEELAILTNNSFWQTQSRDTSPIEQIRDEEAIEKNYSIVIQDSASETISNNKSKFKSVHVLKYHENFKLEWIYSSANIRELKKFIKKESFEFHTIKDNLADMQWNCINGMIIAANPGMGKTYFTKHLANKFSVDSEFWIVFIILNELNFENVETLQSCLCNYQKKLNTKGQQIFDSYLTKKSVVILFDGFDEVAPANVDEALRIIKESYELGLKIVVTSREVTRKMLETNLNLLSYTLKPFTTKNKLQFLENYYLDNIIQSDHLNANSFKDKIKQFSDKLLKSCSLSNWDEDFTGIPLQCKLLAEGFQDECQRYCETGEEPIIDKKINLITLYENFIETKFNICVEEKEQIEAKGNTRNKLIKLWRNEFLQKHLIASVQIIFPQIGIKIPDEFFEEIENAENKFGLITKIDENKNPVFLHRTFAEYFAAKWMVKIKEGNTKFDESKRDEYLMFLLEPQYKVVHDLFDKLICIDCELHSAVLNGETTKVKTILDKNGGREESKCGRTALHLLAARGAKHERENETIKRKEEEKYEETLKVLLENAVCCDKEDELLRWTPQQYTNHRNAFGVIDMLLGHQATHLYNLENTSFIKKWNAEEILQLCAEYDYVNVGMTFVDLQAVESNKYKELLKISAENDSDQFAAKLIHCKELNSHELSKMKFKHGDWYENGTLLHIAAEKGNVKMLSVLAQYLDVDIQDEDGRTALWFACKADLISTAKALLERKAKLFSIDKEEWTPMDCALLSRNTELAKYVTKYEFLKVGFGDDVNAILPSNNKGTALNLAARGNNWSTIEKLLSDGANINIADNTNWTALHWAFFTGNFSVGKKLVESAANMFLANIEGETAMEMCLKRGSRELMEFVTSYDVLKSGFGEDINAGLGINKCTALHYAAMGNNLSTIDRLISLGANLNKFDKNGQSVLHYGSSKGHLYAVKALLTKGLQLFLKDNNGHTPMDLAIKSGNRELIEYVTSYDVLKNQFGEYVNAELSGENKGGTAFNFAVLGNNLSTATRLERDGANVNNVDNVGNTSLHAICKSKWINYNIVEFLIQSNLNINAQNHKKQTALHLAVQEGKKGLMKLLLKLGANVNIMDDKNRTTLNVAREENKVDMFRLLFDRTQNRSERDYLHKSVLKNGKNSEVRKKTFIGFPEELTTLVDSLVKSGFYYNGINDTVRCFKCHISLKHWRASFDPFIRHAVESPRCEFLINEKGKQFVQSYKPDYKRETLLHWECRNGNLTAVKDLVQKGVSIFSVDNYGRTAINLAINNGNRDLVEYVTNYDVLKISFGENVNAMLGNSDRTALHFATMGNNFLTIERLLSEGADVNISDYIQQTALHVTYGFEEEDFDINIVRRFIESGANIDAQTRSGVTTLHGFVSIGNRRGVELLLELGANTNIVDNQQRTPLGVAREKMNNEMFLFLFERTQLISKRDALHKSVLTKGNDEEVRRATFVGFPQQLSGLVNLLCRSGFYYIGIEDKVRCFQCGIWCTQLKLIDDIWYSHAICKPECEFLIREKGAKFIESCQRRLLREKPIVEEVNRLIESVTKSGDASGEVVNVQNPKGQTALHSAAWLGKKEMVKSLLELGANVNIVDNRQRTALSVAREKEKEDIFLFLFERTEILNDHDSLYKSVLTKGDDLEVRRATFVGFPPQLSGIVDQLSQSGFFYFGIKDWVSCFQCRLRLQNLRPREDPWFAHALLKPECAFLIQEKGLEYIQSRQQELNLLKQMNNQEKPIEEKVSRLIDSVRNSGESSAININAQDSAGQTALHSAVWLWNKEMVKSLLELGANANIVDNQQRTALSVAREEKNDEMFLLLFEKTEVINERDVLHKSVITKADDLKVRRATFVGFPQQLSGIVNLLSQSGFFYFGIEDHVKCFQCGLVLHKLEPASDAWVMHALHRPKCEFLIREKGLKFIQACQPEYESKETDEIAEEVKRLIDSATNSGETSGEIINAKNLDGRTALHLAAWLGNVEMMKSLLDLGANANIVDKEQRTALNVAREWKYDAIFLILFERTRVKNEDDALHKSALMNGNNEEVRRATFVGFPQQLSVIVNSLSQSGFFYFGIDDYVKCFQCAIQLHNLNPSFDPWFLHAIYNPNCEFLIREKGLEFMQSCQSEAESKETDANSEEVKQLIESTMESEESSETNVNAQNIEGQTTLHTAAMMGNMEMLKSLLELGANVNIEDNRQRTPLSVARENKNNDIFIFLFERTQVISERDALHKSVLMNGDDVEVRRSTFVGFPKELSGMVNLLSQCGFYYFGIEDKIECFQCGLGLGNLKPLFDPWFYHAVYEPKCEFLLREKGLELIQSWQNHYNRSQQRLNREKAIAEDVNRLIDSVTKPGETSEEIINAQNAEGQTCLHSAAWLGNMEMVKLLLELGADANILDNQQRPALSVAREEICDDVFLFLFEKTTVINERDALHKSVLTKADDLEVRRATFVGFPKELPGIDLISQSGFYYFGIEDYVKCCQCSCLMFNFEPTGDPWFDHAKFNPKCEFVIREKGFEFIQSCQLQTGSKKTNKDKTEEVKRFIESVIKSGESSGASINAQNIEGQTVLHSAAWLGHTEMVKSLLELGADANILDNQQRTALSVARINMNNDTFLALWENTQTVSERDIRYYIPLGGKDFDVELRTRTFTGFPQELCGLVNLMAESGLYYVGINDEVKCFRCGGWINRWSPSDDPFARHAMVKPNCTFLIEQMGEQVVKI